MKYLLTTTETYRTDTENEAEQLITDAKADRKYVLQKYNCTKKEVKKAGEVIDEYFVLSLTKVFNDPKDPSTNVDITYEVD